MFVFFEKLIPDAIFLVDRAFVRNFEQKEIKMQHLEEVFQNLDVDLSAFHSLGKQS